MAIKKTLMLQVCLSIVLHLYSTHCEAQRSYYPVPCCVDSLLKRIGRVDAAAELLNGSKCFVSNGYRLIINDTTLELESIKNHRNKVLRNDSIKEWLDCTYSDSNRKVFTIKDNNLQYFILCSPSVNASGIASDFFLYLLLDVHTCKVITLNLDLASLSDNPRLFYIKNGSLFYKLLTVGDIYRKRGSYNEIDFDNLIVKIITYQVKANGLREIKSSERKCPCRKNRKAD